MHSYGHFGGEMSTLRQVLGKISAVKTLEKYRFWLKDCGTYQWNARSNDFYDNGNEVMQDDMMFVEISGIVKPVRIWCLPHDKMKSVPGFL